ncbi:IpaD/SipD/SspD family type III secretion system needle tip protein [Proteus appendicitidis]|uniref:IpaD/SipD/SspD family type III secretion system needle tip protein n=1 Tax=Proteus appendicitidis TaxID=3034648 RepID=A0ABY8Y6R0_9GAMM|nr:IpaD/SipD/SspD family type III secretion system needle tip protein [Proteus sp. HZ0627]WIV88036.1 IpaD/SipD/SspD family type III secretion system needle tip protein [Proteus sp. HZ0627]
MAKAIDSGMSNIASHSKIYSSDNDVVSTSKNGKYILDDMKELLINIRREKKDFDLDNWISCNNLKGKTEREIYVSLSAQYDKNIISHNQCLNIIKKLEPIIKDEIADSGYSTDSLSDFFYEIKQSIVVGKNDYLDVLKDVFSNYMDYVRDLRAAITSIIQYTKAGKKDGCIAINYIELKKTLENVKKEYQEKLGEKSFFHNTLLFEYQNDGNYIRKIGKHLISYKDKEQIHQSLNAIEKLLTDIKGIKVRKENHASEIKNDIGLNFIGYIDFDDLDNFLSKINTDISMDGVLSDAEIEKKRKQLLYDNTSLFGLVRPGFDIEEEMRKVKKDNENKKEEVKYKNILQTEFDLFKKSLDSLEKRMNSNLDELSKKYSSANSNYDNFVKIVSSTMNTLLEMAKGFLQF